MKGEEKNFLLPSKEGALEKAQGLRNRTVESQKKKGGRKDERDTESEKTGSSGRGKTKV